MRQQGFPKSKFFLESLPGGLNWRRIGDMKSVIAFGVVLISVGIAAAQTTASADSPAAAAAHTYIIAHFPWDGGWSTRVLFANNSGSAANVNVSFFDPQNGQPKSVPISVESAQVGEIFASEFSSSLAQASTATSSMSLKISANNVSALGADPSQRNVTNNFKVAWATVTSDVPLNVFSVFDFGNATKISTAVGAQSAPAAKTFRFPISMKGPLKYDAGLAMANPNGQTAVVTIKLLNTDGTVKNSVQKTLPTNGQQLLVVSQAFASDFTGSTLFNGSLAVCSDQPIGLVALGVESGIFFSTSATNDPCPS